MVPFVNGGLFDCLDRVYRNAENQPNVRLDDFSEEKDNRLCIPNELFFGSEHAVDLSEVYQDKRKKNEKVRPIIEILSRYKFTVEENTPLEQEIALDPELLGKVFENLLASYNEDTRTTARKATGSFYTPREVVSYMVDEALITYFLGQLGDGKDQDELETKLRQVFDTTPSAFQNHFSKEETEALIAAIDHIKILDPACGSGAFPMGALHRLVDLLTKLDPINRRWKQKQLERAKCNRLLAEQIQDDKNRENGLHDMEARIKDIEHSFNTQYHALDFARKLYLIENCIFGVDIQPIACQIAKLRFFITLIVDQKVDRGAENLGVRPLPNLETKIVAADTLIGLPLQIALRNPEINRKEAELKLVRQRHFTARTQETKQKQRAEDRRLRLELANLFEQDGFSKETAHQLAQWDPYDQNAHADFLIPSGYSPSQMALT
jgi:adenine-specific DNA-methyltransferase